jgi:hypothetical protein
LIWICQKDQSSMKCPFVYPDDRQRGGEITAARAYVRHRDRIGAVSSLETKERMAFYPSELDEPGVYDEAVTPCPNLRAVQS